MARRCKRVAHGRHRVGLVVNLEPKYSASDEPADREATKRADAYMNRQYLDPIFVGRYPEELEAIFGEAWPAWPFEDFALISQPIDFLGLNYYTRSVTRFDPTAWPLRAAPVRRKQATYTETEWEVFAQGLTDGLVWVNERYGGPPLYITENGAALFDPPTVAGDRLADPLRVDYLRQHIVAIYEAIEAGVDVRG
jgi:beta-glucosidase